MRTQKIKLVKMLGILLCAAFLLILIPVVQPLDVHAEEWDYCDDSGVDYLVSKLKSLYPD